VPMTSWPHFQRDLFLWGKRSGAESVAKLFGRSLLSFADFATINDDLVLGAELSNRMASPGFASEASLNGFPMVRQSLDTMAPMIPTGG
jgi:hypothetical protein